MMNYLEEYYKNEAERQQERVNEAHFCIGWLKSMLERQGVSREEIETQHDNARAAYQEDFSYRGNL